MKTYRACLNCGLWVWMEKDQTFCSWCSLGKNSTGPTGDIEATRKATKEAIAQTECNCG